MNPAARNWRHELREAVSDLTPGVTLCILFLIAVFIAGSLAPWIAPYGEGQILTNESFAPPSATMWLGSDYLGRDVLSRLIHGVRITLFLALIITFLSFFAGVGLGFLAAAFGGRVDSWMSRLNDAMLSFPALIWRSSSSTPSGHPSSCWCALWRSST